jgi:2-polyprenyl-6-hydroxyphenyl methylase/3-demethylubiquinone-9 3-methyltransferase
VQGAPQIQEFFDEVASDYAESHGEPDRLFGYRLQLLKTLMAGARRGILVEIGCGPGQHLMALADDFERAIGLDLSPAMINRAEIARFDHPLRERIRFAVDPAEELRTLSPQTIDVLFCVGALEHIPQKTLVLRQIRRVLVPEGRFICLTPNGGYIWYAHVARWLGCEVRHLSTDQFITARELRKLLTAAGFATETLGYWTFIPRGDMPAPAARLMDLLDGAGRLFRLPALRGGLCVRARLASDPPAASAKPNPQPVA